MTATTFTSTPEPLDHPSYLVRQRLELGVSTAGANTISSYTAVIFPMRVRGGVAYSIVAGTSATSGHQAQVLYYGTSVQGTTTTTTTATLGTVNLGTATAAPSFTEGPQNFTDFNAYLEPNGYLALKNGTDATGTYKVSLEWYHDPVKSKWTAGN